MTATSNKDFFTIRDLAEAFGISTRAIRFYEARGLISPERIGTTRRYTKRDRARLSLILRGKNLGFSLEDIGEYLSLYDADPAQRAQTEMLLHRIEETIVDLEKKRADIDHSLDELKTLQVKCIEHLKSLEPDTS